MRHIAVLPTSASSGQHTAQPGNISTTRSSVVARKNPTVSVMLPKQSNATVVISPGISASGKSDSLLKKPSTAAEARSTSVSLIRVSNAQNLASKVFVLNTSGSQKQPVKFVSTSQARLPASSVITSRPASSTTVVIIRSSTSSSSSSPANVITKLTSSASTFVKSSSGSVVMSVKKILSTVPLTTKAVGGFVPIQPKLSPVVKLPPFRRMGSQGNGVAVVRQRINTVLHDKLKTLTTNADQTGHVKRSLIFITI